MNERGRVHYTPAVTSNRRQRELARAKFERQQSRREGSARRRKRGQRIAGIVAIGVVVLAVIALIVVPRLTTPDPAIDAGAEATPSAAPSPSASPLPEPAASSLAPSSNPAPSLSPVTPAVACAPVPTSTPSSLSWSAAPTNGPTPGSLTLATNCGDIVIDLLPDAAPKTVASVQFLARQGFYDSTDCHRLTTAGIFVLQCGDPTATGMGNPGYQVPDENLPADGPANYPAGTVAMANSGPNTAGSQFFIVYQDTQLPPAYTVWGRVTKGLDIVTGVAAAGAYGGTGDGRPLQPITIEKATITGA